MSLKCSTMLLQVYAQTVAAANGQSAYCQYNNEYLQLFTSSLFLAGMIAAMVGGCTTRCAMCSVCTSYQLQASAETSRGSSSLPQGGGKLGGKVGSVLRVWV